MIYDLTYIKTPSPSPSLTLPVRKRYRGTYELILDTDSEGDELGDEDIKEDREDKTSDGDDERERSEDEGLCLEGKEEEVVPEGQQQAVSATDTAVCKPLGLGYGTLRRRELAVGKDHVPSTFEVGQSSRSVPEQQGGLLPPVTPVQTPPSPEWSSNSLPVLPSSPLVLSPIASPATTPAATISIDKD
nr:hypothetical protein [Tanacetum cinerariifolium]